MSIEINTIKPHLQIRTTNGKMEIRQPQGDLSIRQEKAKMIVRGKMPRVIIDQYQCFAEAGLKNCRDMIKEYAQLGYRKALEGIARRVSEGNRFINIGKHGFKAIPQVCLESAWTKQHEFNYDIIPKSRPSIEIEGEQSIDWELGGANIYYTPRRPMISFQKGNVEIYLNQKPSIEFRYIDEER